MPTVANYIVIQDTDITLGEDDNVQFDFTAPDLTASTSLSNRPMVLFKLNPHADNGRLEIVLNNNVIFAQTFSAGPIRSLNEVLATVSCYQALVRTGCLSQIVSRGNSLFLIWPSCTRRTFKPSERRRAALDGAIDLLEGDNATKFGDIVETASGCS